MLRGDSARTAALSCDSANTFIQITGDQSAVTVAKVQRAGDRWRVTLRIGSHETVPLNLVRQAGHYVVC
ncbi:hypothetical protein [uncultured Jatrophihabitans sp.]|uniref:hypothetical protein n=1 Tax=uncultured Jatrophihabitans sp. TaxID=1610747 RepID=UPI0035CB6028